MKEEDRKKMATALHMFMLFEYIHRQKMTTSNRDCRNEGHHYW